MLIAGIAVGKEEQHAYAVVALANLDGQTGAFALTRERAALAGRVVQRRTIGAPCERSRGESPGSHQARSKPPLGPAGPKRRGAKGVQSRDPRRGPNQARHSRRRMAARQFLPDRRTDSNGPAASAPGI